MGCARPYDVGITECRCLFFIEIKASELKIKEAMSFMNAKVEKDKKQK